MSPEHVTPELVEKMCAKMKRAPKQLDLLRRIVASSGGGLSEYSEPRAIWTALHDKELVQGKSGQPWRIVHTPLGLAVVRALGRELALAARS